MNAWWKTFFDDDYFAIWRQLLTEENNAKQAAELWLMLDLSPGCQDAPCGWGRLSHPLATMGATVLGVDQSETMLAIAESNRGELPPERLRYLRHDLRTPLPETGFDVACNVFTSFGYGTEDDDLAIFQTLRGAVRRGGRVIVETNHRDLRCALIAVGAKASKRLPDGTLFIDDSDFDAISGIERLNWYWSGPPARRTSIHGGLQRIIENPIQSRRARGWGATGCGCGSRRLAGSMATGSSVMPE